ncbi:hypothetical protein A2U01_0108615, partial [Trifolium medium]|nr:hypothetical protein [Trifolium medium]
MQRTAYTVSVQRTAGRYIEFCVDAEDCLHGVDAKDYWH